MQQFVFSVSMSSTGGSIAASYQIDIPH
jgi:hypothetical protein